MSHFLHLPLLMAIYHVFGAYVIAGVTLFYALLSAIRLRPSAKRNGQVRPDNPGGETGDAVAGDRQEQLLPR